MYKGIQKTKPNKKEKTTTPATKTNSTPKEQDYIRNYKKV